MDAVCKVEDTTKYRLRYFAYAFLIAIFIPNEFDLNLAGLQISFYRMVLLISLPIAFVTYFRNEIRNFAFADLWVFLFSFWAALSHVVSAGLDGGAASAGILVVETLGPYLLARLCIRSLDDFQTFASILAKSILVLFFVAGAESILVSYFVHETAASFVGMPFHVAPETRTGGLGRAEGPFDHPILYGAYCASAFGIIWYSYGGFKKLVYAMLCLGAAYWSQSSAPLLAIGVQIAFIAYERVTRPFSHRVLFITVGIILLLCALQAISDRPIVEIAISKLTLDPQTAWFRLSIWDYASATIEKYPILGIAYQYSLYEATLPSWMNLGLNSRFSSSVDSFVLLNALLYGMPAAIFLCLGAISAIYHVASARRETQMPRVHAAAMGWSASFFALCFVSITVHYWANMHAFFFFLLGCGAWLNRRAERSQQSGEVEVLRVPPVSLTPAMSGSRQHSL